MDLRLMPEFQDMRSAMNGMPRLRLPKSACVILPLVGEITTVCLDYLGWYSAHVDLSGIDFLWDDPGHVKAKVKWT